MQQSGKVDYSDEGGPTVNCGPSMANGRGPKRYLKYLPKIKNCKICMPRAGNIIK